MLKLFGNSVQKRLARRSEIQHGTQGISIRKEGGSGGSFRVVFELVELADEFLLLGSQFPLLVEQFLPGNGPPLFGDLFDFRLGVLHFHRFGADNGNAFRRFDGPRGFGCCRLWDGNRHGYRLRGSSCGLLVWNRGRVSSWGVGLVRLPFGCPPLAHCRGDGFSLVERSLLQDLQKTNLGLARPAPANHLVEGMSSVPRMSLLIQRLRLAQDFREGIVSQHEFTTPTCQMPRSMFGHSGGSPAPWAKPSDWLSATATNVTGNKMQGK